MSAVILGGIIALVSALIGKNYLATHNTNTNQIEVRNDQGQVVGTIPLSLNSFRYFKCFLSRSLSALSQIDLTKIAIQISNPYADQDVIVTSISIVPDANFKLHGTIQIHMNGQSIFDAPAIGSFTDITDFQVPLPEGGYKLLGSKTIDMFLVDDGVHGNVSVLVAVAKY